MTTFETGKDCKIIIEKHDGTRIELTSVVDCKIEIDDFTVTGTTNAVFGGTLVKLVVHCYHLDYIKKDGEKKCLKEKKKQLKRRIIVKK